MQKLQPQPLLKLLPMQWTLQGMQLTQLATPSTLLAKMPTTQLVAQLMPLEKPSTKLARKLRRLSKK